MPVSRISRVGMRSSTLGAGRWIGQRSSASTSPALSIGSPSRLKMRPSVPAPTGTVIGPPVSRTRVPRASPSVASMATARMRSSPRCCCTSSTRRSRSCRRRTPPRGRCRSRAGGRVNTTSTTTPWTSSTVPTLSFSVSRLSCWVCVPASKFLSPCDLTADAQADALGPRDDLHDLLRDLGLALAVGRESEVVDQLGGVVGCVAHGAHAGAVLGRRRLEQRPEDGYLDVVGHEPGEDLLGVGLVDPRARAMALVRSPSSRGPPRPRVRRRRRPGCPPAGAAAASRRAPPGSPPR